MKTHAANNDGLLRIFLIFLVVVLSYFNILQALFVYDDLSLITHNPNIRSWENIPRIFTSGYWDSSGVSGDLTGLYRPLAMLSFLLEHSLAGLSPWLYHFDNILLHFLCSVAVLFLLENIWTEGEVPLVAALFFAVHPVHTEAVSWVSGRAELLSTLFILLSLLCALGKQKAETALSWIFFLLGILSKETAAVMPLLLAAYLVLFGTKAGTTKDVAVIILKKVSPYLVILACYLLLRFWVLGGLLGPSGSGRYFSSVGPYDVFLSMCEAFAQYMRLAFLPFNLTAFYGFPPPASLMDPQVIAFLAVILIAVVSAPVLARCCRPVLFAELWFFIALLPVSNIIPTGILMSERAMYLPSLASCIIIGLMITKVAYSTDVIRRRAVVAALTAFILTPLIIGTVKRNTVWKDAGSFWTAQMASPGTGFIAHFNYGNYLYENGHVNEAIQEFQTALQLNHSLCGAHNSLGRAYFEIGLTDKAILEFKEAVRVHPDFPEALNNLGFAYYRIGHYKEALVDFSKAEQLLPGSFEIHNNLGLDYGCIGKYKSAAVEFQKAVELNPTFTEAYRNLGVTYDVMGQSDKAREYLEFAVRLDPGSADAQHQLGLVYAENGQFDKAVEHLSVASRLSPNDHVISADLAAARNMSSR